MTGHILCQSLFGQNVKPILFSPIDNFNGNDMYINFLDRNIVICHIFDARQESLRKLFFSFFFLVRYVRISPTKTFLLSYYLKHHHEKRFKKRKEKNKIEKKSITNSRKINGEAHISQIYCKFRTINISVKNG